MLAKVPSLVSSSEFSELYTMEGCAACKSSITKLIDASYKFNIVALDDNNMKQAFELWEHRLGKNPNSVPQFWYNGQYIGGSVEIAKFIKENNAS